MKRDYKSTKRAEGPEINDPRVTWRYNPRLEPGIYRGYARSSKIYRDRIFKRWVCIVNFDLLEGSVLCRFCAIAGLCSQPLPESSLQEYVIGI